MEKDVVSSSQYIAISQPLKAHGEEQSIPKSNADVELQLIHMRKCIIIIIIINLFPETADHYLEKTVKITLENTEGNKSSKKIIYVKSDGRDWK